MRRPFDVKVHEKKDEIPPRACRPSKKLKTKKSTKWITKKLKTNNVEQVGPKKLKKNNVEKVGLYMLIYLHIPPYTSKCSILAIRALT